MKRSSKLSRIGQTVLLLGLLLSLATGCKKDEAGDIGSAGGKGGDRDLGGEIVDPPYTGPSEEEIAAELQARANDDASERNRDFLLE